MFRIDKHLALSTNAIREHPFTQLMVGFFKRMNTCQYFIGNYSMGVRCDSWWIDSIMLNILVRRLHFFFIHWFIIKTELRDSTSSTLYNFFNAFQQLRYLLTKSSQLRTICPTCDFVMETTKSAYCREALQRRLIKTRAGASSSALGQTCKSPNLPVSMRTLKSQRLRVTTFMQQYHSWNNE